MTRPIALSMIALAALAACATDPNPPTVSENDVDRAFAEASRISRLPETSLTELPTGTVTYDGQIGADIRGDANGSILADMTMVVGFASNDISGDVTNINLIDPDGTPNQELGGRLEINGVERGGSLDATAHGDITHVDANGFEEDAQMNLNLNGEVHNDVINGDAIFGNAIGDARGEFDIDIDGVFFGTQR